MGLLIIAYLVIQLTKNRMKEANSSLLLAFLNIDILLLITFMNKFLMAMILNHLWNACINVTFWIYCHYSTQYLLFFPVFSQLSWILSNLIFYGLICIVYVLWAKKGPKRNVSCTYWNICLMYAHCLFSISNYPH